MAASRFIRFFSRRQTKTSDTKQASKEKFHEVNPIKNGLVCTIILLDGEEINFEVDRKALGKTLYDRVITHIKLFEPDYFGLQFFDTYNVKQWLDPTKSIKKQCKIGPPYTFRFRVKFYTSDPQNLRDELTRYLFVLQLKEDIRTGKLDCPLDTDVELAALTMQAELGDYIKDEHSIENISEFHFLPDEQQTEDFEEQVLTKWSTYKGLTPADCEIQYLNKARWLEMYGVDLHTVMGKDGLEYKLGLTPTGILVFENRIKIGLFVWTKVTRIDFHRSKLTIVVVEDDDNDPRLQRDFVFLFRCHDEKQAKHFWKCALECHIFFRTTSASKIKQGNKSNFTRTASRFRFSGRTECQTTALGNLTNHNRNFERKASQRFSRRASYAIRKKIQEQEILREQEDERLRKLKCEQEAKLNEHKSQTNLSNQDVITVIPKRSSSQKNINLSAAQRLDNLIQSAQDDVPSKEKELENNSTNLVPAPPVPPRQIKSDEKTTTPPPPLILVKQSTPVNSHSNDNTKKETSNEVISNGHHHHHHADDDNDHAFLIPTSPPPSLTNGHSRIGKPNSSSPRYTLATSPPAPYVVKETYFYSETIKNDQTKNSPVAPVIITRTQSQSNVRNATSTIVQTTSSNSSSIQLPQVYPRNSLSSLITVPTYHPITTEL